MTLSWETIDHLTKYSHVFDFHPHEKHGFVLVVNVLTHIFYLALNVYLSLLIGKGEEKKDNKTEPLMAYPQEIV
jgi:hypothetical protein